MMNDAEMDICTIKIFLMRFICRFAKNIHRKWAVFSLHGANSTSQKKILSEHTTS